MNQYLPLTESRIDLFFEMLAEVYSPNEACKLAGVSRGAMFGRKKKDEDFAERWKDSQRQCVEDTVAECRRRAVEGVDVPYMYKGEVVTVLKKRSDDLIKFLLEAWDKPMYGKQKVEITGAQGSPLIPETVGDIEIARRVAFILAEAVRNKKMKDITPEAEVIA